METAVRKATRLDYNPPKQKHLQTLINLTYQNPKNAADIIELLEKRLRENSWIIIFKVLITIHTLMRLGDSERAIIYVETRPSALDTSRLREKSSGVVHIQNIYLYTAYLEQKVIAFRHLKYDYVKNTMDSKVGKLRRLSVKDGLLRDTVVLQKQIGTLLKCNFILDDVDNNISLYAYRLLVEDLLVLFQVINEAIVNILEHYFAMEKPDARTSLDIYKRFARQTEETISFLDRAKILQHELHIAIPTVKHAPLSLATALEEYLDDNNSNPNIVQSQPQNVTSNNNNNHRQSQPKELIDFFTSLENEKVNIFYNPVVQQPQPLSMFSSPQPNMLAVTNQPNMITAQPTGHNPFRTNTTLDTSMQQLSLVPQQSISSNNIQSNPFRASTMPQMSFSSPTNFTTSNSMILNSSNSNWMLQQQPQSQPQPQQQLQPSPQPQSSLSTSNNPFATNNSLQSSSSNMMVSSPITMNTNNNPFANNSSKQQLQPWGSSVF